MRCDCPDDNLNAQESDVYDSHSLHGLLIHRPTGLAFGSVRAITPLADRRQESLPIQSLCRHPMLRDHESIMQSVEGSRFCISRAMRQQICTANAHHLSPDAPRQPVTSPATPELREVVARTRRLLPYLPVGLAKLLLQITVERQLSYIFATVDPRLLNLFDKFGICSERLGEDIDHHGLRAPALFRPLSIFENTYAHKREIWKIITDNGRLHDLALKNSQSSRAKAGTKH